MTEILCYDCGGDEWCHTCGGGGTVDEEQAASHAAFATQTLDIVFDGPPSHESGRFVGVEDADGKSVSLGEWMDRGDGYWALRVEAVPNSPLRTQKLAEFAELRREMDARAPAARTPEEEA